MGSKRAVRLCLGPVAVPTVLTAPAEMSATSWSNSFIRAVILNIPPGQYYFTISDGGQLITSAANVSFTVD